MTTQCSLYTLRFCHWPDCSSGQLFLVWLVGSAAPVWASSGGYGCGKHAVPFCSLVSGTTSCSSVTLHSKLYLLLAEASVRLCIFRACSSRLLIPTCWKKKGLCRGALQSCRDGRPWIGQRRPSPLNEGFPYLLIAPLLAGIQCAATNNM